jgi:branched-chain amino acid transport system substrate-binding protein
MSVVYSAEVSSTASDYTAQCQALKASGANSLYVGSSSEVAIRVTQACVTQGVTAKPVTLDGSVTEAFASTPALNGTLSAEADFPFIDNSVPASQAYQTAIAKYAPNLGTLNGPNAAYGWVAGELFQKAVEDGGTAGPITTATVLKGLYSMKGETLGGIAPPLTFTPGQPSLINCYFTMGLSNGKFTAPDGLKTACAPDALIKPIAAKLLGG